MNKETNIKELLANQWKNKKAFILKELDLKYYLSEYWRYKVKNAYQENRSFTLIELLMISKEADDLISKGYTGDEIIRAVREWVKERLDEIEKEIRLE